MFRRLPPIENIAPRSGRSRPLRVLPTRARQSRIVPLLRGVSRSDPPPPRRAATVLHPAAVVHPALAHSPRRHGGAVADAGCTALGVAAPAPPLLFGVTSAVLLGQAATPRRHRSACSGRPSPRRRGGAVVVAGCTALGVAARAPPILFGVRRRCCWGRRPPPDAAALLARGIPPAPPRRRRRRRRRHRPRCCGVRPSLTFGVASAVLLGQAAAPRRHDSACSRRPSPRRRGGAVVVAGCTALGVVAPAPPLLFGVRRRCCWGRRPPPDATALLARGVSPRAAVAAPSPSPAAPLSALQRPLPRSFLSSRRRCC